MGGEGSGRKKRGEKAPEPIEEGLEVEVVEPKKKNHPAYDDDLLETSLVTPIESENTVKSVSKELFTSGNIELKTQLTHDEINHLTRVTFMQEKFRVKNIKQLRADFLTLRVSMDRKSRGEFIEALQTEKRNENGVGMLGRLFGKQDNNP